MKKFIKKALTAVAFTTAYLLGTIVGGVAILGFLVGGLTVLGVLHG